MPLAKLIRVVLQNIARSKKNFIFSSIGIIVGITTFTFFIALSQGVRDRVLNRMFPIDQLEVEPVGGVAASESDGEKKGEGLGSMLAGGPRVLDAGAVSQLEHVEGVERAYPKMRARFPAKVETGVLDRRMAGEGFMEGLEPSEQILTEMRDFEHDQHCGALEEDTCNRRQVPCKADKECPHEGMECEAGMCKPRQYWRSFKDKTPGGPCTSAAHCADGQVCGYDRWILLKVGKKEDIAPLRQAIEAAAHPSLDMDLYVAIADAGAVETQDLINAERVQGEVWSVGAPLSEKAAAERKDHKDVPLHEFATAQDALAYLAKLPASIPGGVCSGERCELDQAENDIKSEWKYFNVFENHRGTCGHGYCAARNVLSKRGRCEEYMPVAMSPVMIDFYNANVVSQLGTRPLPNACFVLGLKGYFRLGFSFLRESMEPVWQRIRWAEIVGFTNKAMTLGGTVPLGYVNRYNHFYLGPESVKTYDSVLLSIPRNEKVASVIEQIQKQSFDLSRNSRFARQAGEMLLIVTLVFLLISLIIIFISALNISHTFLMVIYERQREIGVMRAIGASRMDIRKIILLESLFIGLVGGLIGNGLSYGVSRIVNLLAAGLRARFPVIPDDFFMYSWPLIGGSIAFALVFCLVGAWVPASRAAKLDPAVVLASA